MGFLKDIQDMPNQYEYSCLFFQRYYRPEYTTIILAGDLNVEQARALVQKYWGGWKRGSYRPEIPVEPPPSGPRANHLNWPSPTLPWVVAAFRGPAYSDTDPDQVALDLIAYLGFSESSELYQKLVIREQKVDMLEAESPDRVDPYLFTVWARVKKESDVAGVRDEILAALEGFRHKPVDAARLDRVKRHLRYRFILSLRDSEAVAGTLARFVALRRTPETINRVYDLYDRLTPADLQAVAQKYFREEGRTIVTLSGGRSQ